MSNSKKVLLIAMPFAGVTIPSIQLPILESYCKEKNIDTQTRHLYLKAAETYGLINYNALIHPPNDSYNAQIVFAKYVFPDHWEKTKDKFEHFYTNKIQKSPLFKSKLPFNSYVEKTDAFYRWTIESVNWNDYDIIGFTLNYGQLLPSLAVAKEIKNLYPEKKIILGGSRTVGELGINILKTFDYIDFNVSGDGEDALYQLAKGNEDYETIPRLMYRADNEVKWNRSNIITDFNNSPIPNFDSFFSELDSVSLDFQQYFHLQGKLPVEISRGCWWNKCTFCNLSIQHDQYHEKTVDQIIEEINFLSDRYQILNFQMIGNTLLKTSYKELFEKICKLEQDYTFFVEARAGRLKNNDYKLMREAGFTIIQTGVETFSPHYINKMNKGTRVIDNIASLKFCKEYGILNTYNLIVNYPNEESVDYEESKQNIKGFYSYLDPPQLSNLIVEYGSDIYKQPENYNIESFDYIESDKLMFPAEVLANNISFFFKFNRKKEMKKNDWDKLVDLWAQRHETLKHESIQRQTELDLFVFYYVDGGNFLKIYDKRDKEQIQIYVLNELERRVLLSCVDVTSYHKLQEKLPDIPDHQLAPILHSFEKDGIVFHEDESYLCLPLNYQEIMHLKRQKITEPFVYC